MAGDSKDVVEVSPTAEATERSAQEKEKKKKKSGIISRIWNGIFRLHGDDFEKRLQHISKEEAAVLARMKRRSMSWRRMARNLIVFSVLLEVVAVGYAIMTTRTLDLDWKMRALRVVPMFLLPALSSLLYSAFASFTRMCDSKDQKTVERLRAERQAKIDELKEKTNYYTTQQLIQRYDSDPAAKAAAATVLASKLGADSGLKVFLGDELQPNPLSAGKSNDVEFAQSSSGLRRRNSADPRTNQKTVFEHSDQETQQHVGSDAAEMYDNHHVVVAHQDPNSLNSEGGGWIARIAALLVGEDPTQSYALICGNCHMHNGLARKEDFPFITYYCPHCRALNKPKHMEEGFSSGITAPDLASTTSMDEYKLVRDDAAEIKLIDSGGESLSEKESAGNTPTETSLEGVEATERIVPEVISS